LKESTRESLEEYMLEQYAHCGDGESFLDTAIGVLDWYSQKLTKESPDTTSEISWLDNASESLETIKNEEMYDLEDDN
jgi:hypothetical protein